MNTPQPTRWLPAAAPLFAAALLQPVVACILAGTVATIAAGALVGVVLPAVWSRRPARRRAANRVLAHLLPQRQHSSRIS
jgi:hypothetical protein